MGVGVPAGWVARVWRRRPRRQDGNGGSGAAGGTGGDGLGGAIYNAGTLTVDQCVFLQDQAVAGGGGTVVAVARSRPTRMLGATAGRAALGARAAQVAAGRSTTPGR